MRYMRVNIERKVRSIGAIMGSQAANTCQMEFVCDVSLSAYRLKGNRQGSHTLDLTFFPSSPVVWVVEELLVPSTFWTFLRRILAESSAPVVEATSASAMAVDPFSLGTGGNWIRRC